MHSSFLVNDLLRQLQKLFCLRELPVFPVLDFKHPKHLF